MNQVKMKKKAAARILSHPLSHKVCKQQLCLVFKRFWPSWRCPGSYKGQPQAPGQTPHSLKRIKFIWLLCMDKRGKEYSSAQLD